MPNRRPAKPSATAISRPRKAPKPPAISKRSTSSGKAPATSKPSARDKLLDAAVKVVRQKGYAATTVDDLCQTAGVTKGAFFHHFESKEDLAVAAAHYWSDFTTEFFDKAPYQKHSDPLDRLLAYIDFRREILQGNIEDFTCLLGTMVQEAYATSPKIRKACDASISRHAAAVAQDIAAAKKLYARDAKWDPEELALFTQVVVQGAFILAKAKQGPKAAEASILHLKRYVECLFNKNSER
jgi:TetR/AcrR family transcriptional repressor of nem operon